MSWPVVLVLGVVSLGWFAVPPGAPRLAVTGPARLPPPLAIGSVLVVVLLPMLGADAVVVGVAAAGVIAGSRALVRGWLERRRRRRRQRGVIDLVDALAAELHAGMPALVALERACEVHPELSVVGASARLGADVPGALRDLSARSGWEALRAVAAGWRVASHTGAGLAGVLDSIGRGLRHDEDARAELEAALGPTRATARLLAALPVFGLGLGQSTGAHPIAFLIETSLGRLCLGSGLLLAVVGVVWVDRIARSAEVPA